MHRAALLIVNIAHVNNAHRGMEVLSLLIRMHNIELDSISGADWSQKVGIGETLQNQQIHNKSILSILANDLSFTIKTSKVKIEAND